MGKHCMRKKKVWPRMVKLTTVPCKKCPGALHAWHLHRGVREKLPSTLTQPRRLPNISPHGLPPCGLPPSALENSPFTLRRHSPGERRLSACPFQVLPQWSPRRLGMGSQPLQQGGARLRKCAQEQTWSRMQAQRGSAPSSSKRGAPGANIFGALARGTFCKL